MNDDDDGKPPYRAPGWLVPYGVAVSVLLAAAGIACVWPGAPVVVHILGPGAYELTGWFLLYGAAAVAFNLNLAEPVAIGPTLWWGLFGPPPLMVFILVSGLLGWFAVNVEPMSGHGIALALVALLAVPVLLAGDHTDEPEPAFSYGAREIQRDPLSLAPEPRQEPLVESDPGYTDYAREIVSTFLRSILLFGHLVYMPAWVLGLGQDMFGGAKDWPGKTVQELYSGDFLEYHLFLAAFFTVGFFALLILGAAFPGLRRRRTFTSADND